MKWHVEDVKLVVKAVSWTAFGIILVLMALHFGFGLMTKDTFQKMETVAAVVAILAISFLLSLRREKGEEYHDDR